MYHFKYVPRTEYLPIKKELIELIKEVQNQVRDKFKFQFEFIGSTKRNMITEDIRSNIGFDFDVNLRVNNDNNYTPKEIRTILRTAITGVSRKYGYDRCEDSTRVITTVKISSKNSSVLHSCDFAIVKGNKYIWFDKKNNVYVWAQQPKDFINLDKKAKELRKDFGKWKVVKEKYLKKKNENKDPNKHSRSLYAETINEVYDKFYHWLSDSLTLIVKNTIIKACDFFPIS